MFYLFSEPDVLKTFFCIVLKTFFKGFKRVLKHLYKTFKGFKRVLKHLYKTFIKPL